MGKPGKTLAFILGISIGVTIESVRGNQAYRLKLQSVRDSLTPSRATVYNGIVDPEITIITNGGRRYYFYNCQSWSDEGKCVLYHLDSVSRDK